LTFDRWRSSEQGIQSMDTKRHLHLFMPRESRFFAPRRRGLPVAFKWGHSWPSPGEYITSRLAAVGRPGPNLPDQAGADRIWRIGGFLFFWIEIGPIEILFRGRSADHGGGLGLFLFTSLGACVVWLNLPARKRSGTDRVSSLSNAGSRATANAARPAASTRAGAYTKTAPLRVHPTWVLLARGSQVATGAGRGVFYFTDAPRQLARDLVTARTGSGWRI